MTCCARWDGLYEKYGSIRPLDLSCEEAVEVVCPNQSLGIIFAKKDNEMVIVAVSGQATAQVGDYRIPILHGGLSHARSIHS